VKKWLVCALAGLSILACDRKDEKGLAQTVPPSAPPVAASPDDPSNQSIEKAIGVIAVEVESVSGPEREQHSGYPLYEMKARVLHVFKCPDLPQEHGGVAKAGEDVVVICRWPQPDGANPDFPLTRGMKVSLFAQRLWRDAGDRQIRDHGMLRAFLEGDGFVLYHSFSKVRLEKALETKRPGQ